MKKLEEFIARKRLKEFQIDEDYFRHINGGVFGEVYRLTQKHVGKVLQPWANDRIKLLKKENEICKIAYENGISVPKPEGIFNIMPHEDKKLSISFVMEYVEGPTLKEIGYNYKDSILYSEVFNLAIEEVAKAKEIGLKPSDHECEENIIWCEKKEKVYLIDFGWWEFE